MSPYNAVHRIIPATELARRIERRALRIALATVDGRRWSLLGALVGACNRWDARIDELDRDL